MVIGVPCSAVQAGGRRLLQDPVGTGEKMYMIVGFEVVACSIKREAGKEIQNIPCRSPDDADAPEPQEVSKGKPAFSFSCSPSAQLCVLGVFAADTCQREV